MDFENPAEETYSIEENRYTVTLQKITSQSVILAISDAKTMMHYASSEAISLSSINVNALQKALQMAKGFSYELSTEK